MNIKAICAFLKPHKWKIALAAIGFIIAVLMLTIGFFRTLLLLLFTLPGLFYGYLVDKMGFAGANKAVAEFFARLFKR